MYLKDIAVQGFKSFADKTDLAFGSGITAIVGPNGSGKSNVSDAVRWVLGEQSAKSLRGANMQDVIFSGTQKRKPLSFASVTITLDNSQKMLPIEADEVKVTRRVHRSGESEYLINNSACRLKDVHELFMDTGLGRDGYSLIGQGKIDEILSSKAEDRRRIFEEAAGISKYKYKKIEAERKLEQTEDNLLRIKDIISALAEQVEPLEEQSRKARTYLDLREKLKGLDVNIAINSIDKCKENIKTFNKNLSVAVEQLEAENKKAAELEQSAEAAEKALDALMVEINGLTEQLFQAERDSGSIKSRVELLKNNIANNDANITKLDAEINVLDEKTELTEAEIKNQEELIGSGKDKILKSSEKIAAAEKKAAELDADIKGKYDEIQRRKDEILKLLNSISDLKAEINSMEMLFENFDRRSAGIKTEYDEKAERIALIKAELEKEEQALSENEAERASRTKELEELKTEYFKLTEALAKEKEVQNALATEFNGKQSRKTALEELEKGYEGYYKSVKSVLAKGFGGVRGVVSKLIDVDEKYAVAIEIALGNAIQNIVVENEDNAKECIGYLKKENVGRATFLPLSTVTGVRLEREPENEKGYIGLACDLIGYAPEYEEIFKNLLGKCVISDNIDNATSIAKKCKYKFKIVTLSGEVIHPGGSMTGGSISNNQKLLSRAKDIEKLKSELAVLEGKLDKSEDIIDGINEKIRHIAERKSVCDSALVSCDHSKVRLMSSCSQKKDIISELERSMSALLDESGNILKEADDIKEKSEKSAEQIALLEGNVSAMRKGLTDFEQGYISAENERDEMARGITQLKVDHANIVKDAELASERCQSMRLNISAFAGQKKDKLEEKAAIIKNTEELKLEIEKAEAEALDFTSGKDEMSTLLADKKAKYEADSSALKLLQKKCREQSEAIYMVNQEIARIENKLSRFELESDQVINKLWEDYELTYTTALEYKRADINLTEAAKEASALKSSIKALGNINLDAIDEYKAVKQKYDFLSEQKNDLDLAKEKLEKIITEVQGEMTVRFTDCFAKIKEKYDVVFKELFGGGTAKLSLSDPSDVLESGIEIEVQPPGKKLQSLLLLSGGERAFAAIALLFAVLEVRPTPFCIFDEVEAALDDVNVYRFADYVKKYSHKTQFIVVTHRRGTMEAADIMYGVTMQEKGVSKVLKLQMEDLEEENV